jgi:hypothetical protein
MDLSPHDESAHQPDSILSRVISALMSGESINPFAKPATAAEGES